MPVLPNITAENAIFDANFQISFHLIVCELVTGCAANLVTFEKSIRDRDV